MSKPKPKLISFDKSADKSTEERARDQTDQMNDLFDWAREVLRKDEIDKAVGVRFA